MHDSNEAQAVYDRLWVSALDTFASGQVKIDPFLLTRDTDTRQGITLVVRPDPPTVARIMAFIDQLREVMPDQYFYRADELHITVLSLIGTGPGFDPQAARIEAYRDYFERLFPQIAPFTVHYRGITASPECVMVCGTAPGSGLDALRDRLRADLPGLGLAGTLDRRYRIVTAHSSIVRFQHPVTDLPRLVDLLASARDLDFGTFEVNTVDFVLHDWFMSHDKTTLLARYALGGT